MNASRELQRRLAAIVGELEKLSLPAGRDGSALLDTLEATERVRQMIRTRAKARLSKEPDALPGWMIALPNGRRDPNARGWVEGKVKVSEHRREAAVRLMQRRTPKGKEGKPA
jgi:hypothetical protein